MSRKGKRLSWLGASYVMFCLEVVCMMNKWTPLDVDNRKELTAFARAYEDLARDGVRFPRGGGFPVLQPAENSPDDQETSKSVKPWSGTTSSRPTPAN
jgi:hypothetical protein